jgi:DNA-binding FadR family transcriptional regulator
LDIPKGLASVAANPFYSSDTNTLLKDNDPNSKTSSMESEKMADNGLEKHEPIKVKIRDGEGNAQKKIMQQVSEHLHPYVPGSTPTSSVA